MKRTIIILFVILSANAYSQKDVFSLGIWHFNKVSGEIEIEGVLRSLESNYTNFYEKQNSKYLIGGIKLDTKSFIWDPRFLIIDIGIEYSPEIRQEDFIVMPNRSDIHTLKKLDLGITLFQNKNISLNSFAGFNQTYFNRETLTNIKSDRIFWGSFLSFKNKYVPFSIRVGQDFNNQEETQTGRMFSREQTNIEGRATKSFFKRDKHDLVYTHYNSIYQNNDFSKSENTHDNIRLQNRIFIDSLKRNIFTSRVSYYNQRGSYNHSRFDVFEDIRLKLPKKISFSANYNYNYQEQEALNFNQHRFKTRLNHKLYLSLTSGIYYEYSKLNHTIYNETNNRGGINFHYTKKTPLKGLLTLGYEYELYNNFVDSDPATISVINEEQILTDGEIVMLNRAYIDPLSIIVRDITGTIIYQLDFDYRIIQRANFIEIQRIPGGQIQNNSTVFVDYISNQPGNYKFLANSNTFSASISIFSKLLELYFRGGNHQYVYIEQTSFLPINNYVQTVYGGRVDLGFLRTGVEYDYFNSSIVPYKMIRFYMNAQKRFFKRLLCSLNGNVRNYKLMDDNSTQFYTDITGKFDYRINPQMNVSLDLGYRDHFGNNIDLNFLTARTEFTSKIRQLDFKVGLEIYRRLYANEQVSVKGAYFKIIRRF